MSPDKRAFGHKIWHKVTILLMYRIGHQVEVCVQNRSPKVNAHVAIKCHSS